MCDSAFSLDGWVPHVWMLPACRRRARGGFVMPKGLKRYVDAVRLL